MTRHYLVLSLAVALLGCKNMGTSSKTLDDSGSVPGSAGPKVAAAAVQASSTLSDLLKCHEELLPYIKDDNHQRIGDRLIDTINRWDFYPSHGPANLVASGQVGGKLGMYLLEQNGVTFFALPPRTDASVASTIFNGDAYDAAYEFDEYNLSVPVAGVTQKVTFVGYNSGPKAASSMYLTCNWNCDDTTESVFALTAGQALPLSDPGATAALMGVITDNFNALLDPSAKIQIYRGEGSLSLSSAISDCMQSFPDGTALGNAIRLATGSTPPAATAPAGNSPSDTAQ